MYAVYGLIDPRDRAVFYVGITDDIYARFLGHIKCDGTNPEKDMRIQEIKACHLMVGMETFELVEGMGQARVRESYWIQHYRHLGAPLANQVIPLPQQRVVQAQEAELCLGPKMTLNEQRRYIAQLIELDMPEKDIYEHVERYISRKLVRVVLLSLKNEAALKRVELLTIREPADLTDAQKIKMLQVMEMDEEHKGQNEIISAIWKCDPNVRQGRAAAEELRLIRSFIAQQARKTLSR